MHMHAYVTTHNRHMCVKHTHTHIAHDNVSTYRKHSLDDLQFSFKRNNALEITRRQLIPYSYFGMDEDVSIKAIQVKTKPQDKNNKNSIQVYESASNYRNKVLPVSVCKVRLTISCMCLLLRAA